MLQLVLQGEVDAFALAAVAQRGVVNVDACHAVSCNKKALKLLASGPGRKKAHSSGADRSRFNPPPVLRPGETAPQSAKTRWFIKAKSFGVVQSACRYLPAASLRLTRARPGR